MNRMRGQGVSGGVAIGPVYFHMRRKPEDMPRTGQDVSAETARWTAARDDAAQALNALAESARNQAGEEAALLFETHRLLTEDEDFDEAVRGLIESESCSAEYAVYAAGERFAALFDAMEDEYMRARSADVRDVARRIVDILTGGERERIDPPGPVILAAEDLAPSETVRLEKAKILGLLLKKGSAGSHTAILARAMGIPAVCGLGEALSEEHAGHTACMDGDEGAVMIDPDELTLKSFRQRAGHADERMRALEKMRGMPDESRDGRRMSVHCSIASPDDIASVLANDGRGVGLYRSEMLFLSSGHLPGEEEQFAAYRAAVSGMKGKRVVIRTLDIGADKQLSYLPMKKEENPAMGMRAVRICLRQPDLFLTQLRALYRASAFGRLSILFPMITSVREVVECRALCRRAMEELEREGIPFDRAAETGVMIETPASVLIAKELAQEADFFSVGTNDLTQYLLACDRQAGDMDGVYDPHHPSVLRAVRMAAEAAHEAGVRIGICGELAGDMEMIPLFLDMGIDELSVPPQKVLEVRGRIRSI